MAPLSRLYVTRFSPPTFTEPTYWSESHCQAEADSFHFDQKFNYYATLVLF